MNDLIFEERLKVADEMIHWSDNRRQADQKELERVKEMYEKNP